MSDERVWLRHVGLAGEDGHGEAFLCPAGAVDDWRAMGWEVTDEPPEDPNPVVAENLAAQQAEAERLTAEATPGKSKTWSKANTTTQEN
jgi:hypothetical protein